jgi:4-amino-4-deoxy-L-arabinose transferase-like glycosyltransferase
MGYGSGGFLLVVGLVLALAVTDRVSGVDLTMVGWIMALVGLAVILLSAFTWNRSRGAHSLGRTVHSDGTETITERRADV